MCQSYKQFLNSQPVAIEYCDFLHNRITPHGF
jgi:hypothetical protein